MASTDALQNASEEEHLRVTTAFIASSNALGDAIVALKRLEALTFDHASLEDIVRERRHLEDEAAANERAFLSYCDCDIGMHPPAPEDVSAIVQLAAELALLTQKTATAAAVFSLANMVGARFRDIRGV